MFNNQTKEYRMSEQKCVWLVIEKYVYTNSSSTHSVKKQANSLREAMEFMVALEKLNEQQDVSYFLASDIDTVISSAVLHHNKAVETKEVV